MDEKILANLQDLGLTKSEARVYVALVARGVSAATDIVRDAQVPHPRIYDIMANLLTKGLVEVQTGKRRKYKAVKPEVAFERLMSRFKEKEETVTQYLSQIYSKRTELPSIWILKGRDNVIDKVVEILYRAENEVLLAIPASLLKNLRNFLRKANKKGVVTSLVVYQDEEKSQLDPKIANYADIRVRETPSSILIKADFKECLLCSHHTVTSQLSIGEDHAVVAGDEEFLKVLSYFFYHSYWCHAEPLSQETPSRKYPKNFVHMWKVIEEVDMLMEKGHTVKAVIKGKNVKDRTSTEVEGEVLESRNINAKIFSLIIKMPNGRKISIGGRGAFLEDIEATFVSLTPI